MFPTQVSDRRGSGAFNVVPRISESWLWGPRPRVSHMVAAPAATAATKYLVARIWLSGSDSQDLVARIC